VDPVAPGLKQKYPQDWTGSAQTARVKPNGASGSWRRYNRSLIAERDLSATNAVLEHFPAGLNRFDGGKQDFRGGAP
jgi:hypothetical protein